MTLAVAKPIPELAPAYVVSRVPQASAMRLTCNQNDLGRHAW